MRQLKYRYNPTTCRYEPVPLQVKNIFGSLLIFTMLSGSLFIGFLFLHSAVFTTQAEQALQKENAVLKVHRTVLKQEISKVHESLASLGKTEGIVHEKLAKELTPKTVLSSLAFTPSQNNSADFYELINKAKAQSENLLHTTRYVNFLFGDNLSISREELNLLTNIPSLQPVENKELTKLASGFGERTHPFHKAKYQHKGIDFVAPRGTLVYASAAGKVNEVRLSDLQMGMGNVIEIDHGNGYKTRYAHLGEVKVKPGQSVPKGAVIGTVGMTGGAVSPHLHFEVLKKNKQVDPVDYLMEGLNSTEYAALRLLAKQKNQSLD
ncbi:MAG: M23 family metallopeptidase [Cyclobacteriaceae bacterium]|nr:M23 family metallopeptidase [Cyclobacteriaceae bacterium]